LGEFSCQMVFDREEGEEESNGVDAWFIYPIDLDSERGRASRKVPI
jgi:hypothetical protein